MWHFILLINSILLTFATLYLVYAFGTAVIYWSWKPFLFALILFFVLGLAEVAIGAINEG